MTNYERIVPLPKSAYSALMQAMNPDERITSERPTSLDPNCNHMGLVLVSPTPEGPRYLYFVPSNEESTRG